MIIHFTTAPHYISQALIIPAITGSSENRILLNDVHTAAIDISISYKESRSGKRSKKAAQIAEECVFRVIELDKGYINWKK